MNKYEIEFIEIERNGEKDLNWFVVFAKDEESAIKEFYREYTHTKNKIFNGIRKME